ncbi:methyltransferase domain-containing protein [Paenibacillus sp. MWE-103]|uniref:Methyltransferase domain-containing protein n=1 Tax=Paenibacillus artemisiicola TaxID=1172618 RepID=A0ABS3WF19_9BACL|nr:methyltransferase domain-containing protein [Paenibacillus artemisiicola]MBO7746912.1 methyltransferase domain-containing protein [Paenibacillus artemisiicola]
MTKKMRSIRRVQAREADFKCPLCGGRMAVLDAGSLVCENRHTFDFAKQGYLNFAPRAQAGGYTKELFEARRRIITESGLYAPLHEQLAEAIAAYGPGAGGPAAIADIGCGEGSHLAMLLRRRGGPDAAAVGVDLAKDAVRLAAAAYEGPIWLAGDLANLPFRDGTFGVLLNILSPANYREFGRLLAPGGLLLKAVPRAGYLRELREALFGGREREPYANDATIARFDRRVRLLDAVRVRHAMLLRQAELRDLTRMTPLAWSADRARTEAFAARDAAEITVDVDLLIGRIGAP